MKFLPSPAMRATHTDYLHPKHLRVLDRRRVYCMAPSSSHYSRLNSKNLPKWRDHHIGETE